MSTPATETPPVTETAPIQPVETEVATETAPIQPIETEIKKMLILRTGDKQEFEIEQSIAIQSGTIRNLVEDDCASAVIPIPNVDSEALTKVIEYLKGHGDSKASKDDLKKFDKNFVESVSDPEDLEAISDLVVAANYLNIPGLLEVTSQYIADFIKDKTVEEVRKLFGIVNDFEEEEEAKIRLDNAWAFE